MFIPIALIMASINLIAWIDKNHIEAIIEEFSVWTPKETGGILMGYRIKNQLWITDIVGPGPNAKHEYFSYSPDNDFHEEEMARIYKSSGRVHTYIGDWHTHPKSSAYLSDRDKKTMKNISGNVPSRLPEPLMLIMGSNPFEIKLWMYQPKTLIAFRPVRLNMKS